MTPRQKRIIGALVIANVALLVTLLIFVPRFSGSRSPLSRPSPVPTYDAQTRLSPACRQRAVQALSQAGLGGRASLAGQTIRFDLVHRITEDGSTEDVAQQVWTALDVARALADDECDAFSRIEIVIEGQGTPRPIWIHAAVDAADLKAFHGGELSESAFIDRVQYRIEPSDGG